MSTGTEAVTAAIVQLRAAGVPDATRDARRLLAHAIDIAPAKLTLVLSEPVTREALAKFRTFVDARATRQPVSQILGQREFWGRNFLVSPDVLDPRPETETLIDALLDRPATRILDLGTGSGCILLTLLAEWSDAFGTGADVSCKGLKVARKNAERLGVSDRVSLVQSDWFDAIDGTFDLIVSNPPYVTEAEMRELAPEVRDWEPHSALVAGRDGLDAYRAILSKAVCHLEPAGRIYFEIGPTQAFDVQRLGQLAGLKPGRIYRDFDGRDRVVDFHLPTAFE